MKNEYQFVYTFQNSFTGTVFAINFVGFDGLVDACHGYFFLSRMLNLLLKKTGKNISSLIPLGV
jgi:hypothetical protein